MATKTLKIEDFQNRVNACISALPKAMQAINLSVAKSAIPLITNRLTNQGKTAQGQSLGAYSDNPMNAMLFSGKSLGSGAEKRVDDYAKKNNGKISYKKFRELNNRPTDHVTLSFSGQTLADIGVISTQTDGTKIKTVIGSLNRYKKDVVNKKGKIVGQLSTGDVLQQLNDKYGNALNTELLDVSDSELQLITNIYEKNLQDFLDKFFE